METTVLGVRLTADQREKLKEIARTNRIKEVDVARLLIEKAIDGEIIISKGKVYGK